MTSSPHRTMHLSRPGSVRSRLTAGLATLAVAATAAAGGVAAQVTTAAPANASCGGFSDVRTGDPYFQAVSWMKCEGITNGYANGSFGRNKSITRGEVAAFMYRQVSPSHPRDGQQYFTDVTKGNTHYDAITWFAQSGLSQGYSDRSYRPNQPVTRGELSAFLQRLAGASHSAPARSPFRDMNSSTPFYASATWMHSAGIARGYTDSTFRPRQDITRGETAVMLKNADPRVQGRGNVSSSALTPLPPANSAPSWTRTAANWATTKANSSSTYYRYGGNGPNAYDCSGFTVGAFSSAGQSLPRRSADQYRAAKSYVSLDKVQVGDLVYWSNNGSASGVYHVAIYVGNGKIAHARNPTEGVTITNLRYSPRNMMSVAGRFH